MRLQGSRHTESLSKHTYTYTDTHINTDNKTVSWLVLNKRK